MIFMEHGIIHSFENYVILLDNNICPVFFSRSPQSFQHFLKVQNVIFINEIYAWLQKKKKKSVGVISVSASPKLKRLLPIKHLILV